MAVTEVAPTSGPNGGAPAGVRRRLDEAPVPGWARVVALARAAARAAEPPCEFACEARDGRLAWRDVRGSAAFLDLLWILEELSGALCEVCGAPGCARERWGGWVRTLCPRHAVDIAAAGPRFGEVYARGWRSLTPPKPERRGG
jgi:hypothetical protein